MRAAERLRIIKEIAPVLADMEWGELNMTLRQFGFSWSSNWDGAKYDYSLLHLQEGDDTELIELRDYLLGEAGVGNREDSAATQFWMHGHFHLFLSHISSRRKFVTAVKDELALFGVDGFVAHRDIEPTKEWVEEIALALSTCDALAAFLTPGFKKSDWTDQEVGYCVARRVLVIPVIMGTTPYGFVARYQGLNVENLEPTEVAVEIIRVLATHDLTAERMADALVDNFVHSDSYVSAQENWRRMQRYVTGWTPHRLRALEASISDNRQIAEAYYLPEKIRAHVVAYSQSEV